MDRRFKAPAVRFFKALVKERFPAFVPLPKSMVQLVLVSPGSTTFAERCNRGHVLFIVLEPGEGSRADFFVMLGWSTDGVPAQGDWSREFMLKIQKGPWPREDLASALLNFEELEGKSAIGAVVIPTPRDELATREFNHRTKEDQKQRMREIAHADETLGEAQIESAVQGTMRAVFERLEPLVRRLRDEVARLPG